MKKIFLCWVVALFCNLIHAQVSSPILGEAEKVRILAYLVNGRSSGGIREPVGSQKGACFILLNCKKGFFSPFADTITRIANNISTILSFYALGSQVNKYDSVYYLIYSYNDSVTIKRRTISVIKDIGSHPPILQQDRLLSVLNVLPFISSGECNGQSTSVKLRAIKGYSPCDDPATYAQALFVVIDEYVCHGKIDVEIVDPIGKTCRISYNPMASDAPIIQFSN